MTEQQMNHQEELAAPSVAEFRPILHRMGTPLGAAVLTATVLLAGSTIDAPADTPPTPHVHLAHEATQAASRLNAHVLEITPTQPVYESKAPIAATTKAANSILRQQTYGKYAIKLSRDLLYKMEPDGVISHDGKNRAC